MRKSPFSNLKCNTPTRANASKTCPSDERSRTLLVKEMMGDFGQLIREKRLTGLIYYSWIGDPPYDVYRCGALTETGRAAIEPIPAP